MSRADMVKRWGTTEWKARTFVRLLEKDGMINKLQETASKSSKITICEYDSYVNSPPNFRQASAKLPPNFRQASAEQTTNINNSFASSCEVVPPSDRQQTAEKTAKQEEKQPTSLVDNIYYCEEENNNRDNNININNNRDNNSSVTASGEKLEVVLLAEGTKITDQMAKTIPPPVAYVREYCRQRGNGVDADAFCAFYESKGWMVGRTKMKKWTAAVVTWEKRRKEEHEERPRRTAGSDPNNGVSEDFLRQLADTLNS